MPPHYIEDALEHLKQQKDDLEISLTIAIEHGDAIEEQLSNANQKLSYEVEERVLAETKLEDVIKTVTRQRDDLEIALNTAVEHGDAIGEHLHQINQQLNVNLTEREALENKLQLLVSSLSRQKQDLEILVETVASHGDEINQEMYKKIDTIEHIAKTDSLTELLNRRAFDISFEREWSHSKRQQIPISLLMIDIDHFKLFNDTFGHIEGDKCLQRVAKSLSLTQYRSTDIVARFGGEEFIILLVDCNLSKAVSIAEEIRQNIEQLALSNPKSPRGYITLSIGVASMVNQKNNEATNLLKLSDSNLYHAKHNGRNLVYFDKQNIKST